MNQSTEGLKSVLGIHAIIAMCSPPLKRKRVEIPANVTNKVCHYKIFHPRASVTEIQDFINKETSLELGKAVFEYNVSKSVDL